MKKIITTAVAASAFAVCVANEGLDKFVSGDGPAVYAAETVVRRVRPGAFADNVGLKSVSLPDATSVGSGAFRGCVSLETVSLPNVADVSRFAGIFSGCPSLREVFLTAVDFTDVARMHGFPWGTTSSVVVFHFRNGNYDRSGRRIE